MENFDRKLVWQVVGLIAAGLAGMVLRALGVGPNFSPGWLFVTGLILNGWGGSLFEKAHREWGEKGWSYQAVEHLVYAGVMTFFGIACFLCAFLFRLADCLWLECICVRNRGTVKPPTTVSRSDLRDT